MPTCLLSSGEVIEYPPPSPAVASFLERVRAAANAPEVSPNELLSLIYGVENPLLDTTLVPGRAMITKAVIANPLYHVMADILFRKQLEYAGQTVDQIAATFTVSVQDAAKQLGITEASVRAAIASHKLAAQMRNGQWYLRPEAIAGYKITNR